MRIALHHLALRLGTHLVAAELSPGDEELLIRRVAVNGRLRLLLLRLLECEICDLYAPQVANRLTQNQLAIVMDARLDIVVIKLIDHALRLGFKALAVLWCPPVIESAL